MHRFGTLLFLSCVLSVTSFSQIQLPSIIRDSMILQRDVPLKIWGWASPNEKLVLKFRGKTFSTKATQTGDWEIQLPPQSFGGPFSMDIKGKNSISLSEILVGDVWYCAGQSNMVHQFKLHRDRYAKEINESNNSRIRQFVVPVRADLIQSSSNTTKSHWKSAVKNDIDDFSIVAYFFAQSIFEKHGIPIGIINASVGGTPIEAWISEGSIGSFPNYQAVLRKNKDTAYVNSVNRIADSISATLSNGENDLGLRSSVKYYDTLLNTANWQKIGVPGFWEDQGHQNLNGVAWYRREIDLPAAAISSNAMLHLGRIVDADEVYINGKRIGKTTYQYPQRRYSVPPGVLKAGRNVIAVRVINYSGDGGFVPGKTCVLVANNFAFNLKGDWDFRVGEVFMPYSGKMVNNLNAQNQPSALYNGMVNPFTKFKVKGFVWYQGESNAERPNDYHELLTSLIKDWRKNWNLPDAPFAYAQLPNFLARQYIPGESNWALIREAQLKTLSEPNTAMAVTTDLGEWNDIHPGNKKDVGLRLALAARKKFYNENNLVASGPVYQSHKIEENKIILHFSEIGSGLLLKNDDVISGFEIAGDDGKFYWANAVLKGEELIVWNEKIFKPKLLRYAWADNPFVTLYNKEGLPASGFQIKL